MEIIGQFNRVQYGISDGFIIDLELKCVISFIDLPHYVLFLFNDRQLLQMIGKYRTINSIDPTNHLILNIPLIQNSDSLHNYYFSPDGLPEVWTQEIGQENGEQRNGQQRNIVQGGYIQTQRGKLFYYLSEAPEHNQETIQVVVPQIHSNDEETNFEMDFNSIAPEYNIGEPQPHPRPYPQPQPEAYHEDNITEPHALPPQPHPANNQSIRTVIQTPPQFTADQLDTFYRLEQGRYSRLHLRCQKIYVNLKIMRCHVISHVDTQLKLALISKTKNQYWASLYTYRGCQGRFQTEESTRHHLSGNCRNTRRFRVKKVWDPSSVSKLCYNILYPAPLRGG